MSHASGLVRFSDGEIKHFEYDGTSDIVLSNLFNDFDSMRALWRRQDWKRCNCGGEEDCMAYSSYGYGFYIECRGCRKCMTLMAEDIDFNYLNEDKDNPKWAEDWYKLNNQE